MGKPSRQLEFERKMRDIARRRANDLIAKLTEWGVIREVAASQLPPGGPELVLDRDPWNDDLDIIHPELFPLYIGGEYHGFVLQAYYRSQDAVGLIKGTRGYIVPLNVFQMILYDCSLYIEHTEIDVRYKSFGDLIAKGAIHQAVNLVLGIKRLVVTVVSPPDTESAEYRFVRLAIRAHKFKNTFDANNVAYLLGAAIVLYVLFKNADASTQEKIAKEVKEAGGVARAWASRKVREYALKFVGKAITNNVFLGLVRRAAGTVSRSSGYSGFLASIGRSIRNGLILFALSMLGEVERADLGSKQLKRDKPFLYDLLRPHDLDLLWFMLADTFDALEERVAVLLRGQGITVAH